jgi:hypothetical protein
MSHGVALLPPVRERAWARLPGPSAGYVLAVASTWPSDPELLRIYLNDHLAGSVAGVRLARRLAKAQPDHDALRQVAQEIEQDQASLREIMRTLGVRVSRHKTVLAAVAARLGALKFNGRLLRRSPLSTLLELEALHLGVLGKESGWRTVRTAVGGPMVGSVDLDDLLARADRQAKVLEQWHRETAVDVLGGVARS